MQSNKQPCSNNEDRFNILRCVLQQKCSQGYFLPNVCNLNETLFSKVRTTWTQALWYCGRGSNNRDGLVTSGLGACTTWRCWTQMIYVPGAMERENTRFHHAPQKVAQLLSYFWNFPFGNFWLWLTTRMWNHRKGDGGERVAAVLRVFREESLSHGQQPLAFGGGALLSWTCNEFGVGFVFLPLR